MRRVFVASMLVILMVFSVGTYSFQSIDGFEDTDVLIGEGEESATDGRQTATHAEWTMDTLMFSAADCNFSGVSDSHPPASGPNDGVSHYHVVGCGTMNSPPGGDSSLWSVPGKHQGDLDVGLKNWYQTDFEMDQGGNMYVVGTYSGERIVLPIENGADIILNNSGGGYQCSHFDADSGGVDKSQWTCSPDVFVAKMDSNGIWQWAERVDHMGQDSAVKLAVTPSGDVYVGGYTGCDHFGAMFEPYDGVARFGSHSLNVCDHGTGVNAETPGYYGQDWQGYVAKINTNGVWQWVKAIENWDNEASAVWDVAIDPREPDEVYFIGEIGPCDPYLAQIHSNWSTYTNCPTEQNSVIGKIAQVGAPGQVGSVIIDWINYEGIDVTFSEIEAKSAAIFVTGGEHEDAGPSYQHSFGTTSSVQTGDDFITKLDSDGTYEWTRSCQQGRILEMAASANNIAMEVVPGTHCGQLMSQYHGFQIVTLDSGGNWLWSTGDTFDSSSSNLPMTLQWAAYDSSVYNTASSEVPGVLEFDSNGDVVSVRSFGKMMKIGGSTILPSYHRVNDAYQASGGGPNGGWVDAEFAGADTHFSRFDMTSGGMIWSYVEDLPTPCVINCANQPSYFGYPDGYDLGNSQSVWDVEVGGVWDIRISGAVSGHDIQLHDGLPDTDIPYTGPPNHYTRNYYSGGVYFADFEGCVPAPSSPVLVDGSVATTAARWIGDDHNHTWDNYSLLVDPVRYECANETVTPPVTFGCTDPAATNYDPAATVDDGTCVYPAPPLDDCCAHYGSIVNLTGVEKLHIMEITAPSSAGSPQGSSAGFYDISYDIAQETMPGGILVTDFSDSQQMAYSGPMGVGTANNCDLLTGARECYDFYLSDSQGNFDPYGGHLAIRLYASSMAAGNIDGVWLEFTNGNIAYAAVVTHYDPGVFQTYGGGHSLEALGPVSNDPAVTPISNPTGYTQMGGGPGGDFTTLVLCFDVLVNPEYRSGVVEGNEVDRDEEVAAGLGITGAGNTADIVVVGGAGLIVGMGVSSMMVRLRGREPIIVDGELQKEEPTFRD